MSFTVIAMVCLSLYLAYSGVVFVRNRRREGVSWLYENQGRKR